jgi:cytidine deaminase
MHSIMDFEFHASEELIRAATNARSNAYVPYSKFAVGAAVRTSAGKIFAGCNIENISYGLTICAERACLCAAVAAGERQLDEITIVTDGIQPAMPCGACRQVLAEFNAEMLVHCSTLSGVSSTHRLGSLLPMAHQGILEASK